MVHSRLPVAYRLRMPSARASPSSERRFGELKVGDQGDATPIRELSA